MNTDYFIVEYDVASGKIKKISIHYSIDEVFEWLQNNSNIYFTIYKASCILDYS